MSDSELVMPNGELRRINDLVGTSPTVSSLNDNYEFVWNKSFCKSNGKKKVFELITKSGKKIKATKNHPFLTVSGWKWLEELSLGDSIAVPSKLDIKTTREIDDSLPKFLGYLLGDGSIIRNISFTNSNPRLADEFTKCAKTFDGAYVRSESRNGSLSLYVSSHIPHKNNALNYVRSLGLFGKNSYSKFVPNEVFTLSKRQQALFLSRIYACNGWATASDKRDRHHPFCEIGYSSMSEKLVRGISHLLLRFGIRHFVTKKKITYKGTIRYGWNIGIWTKKDITKFINEIGIYGKEEQCYKVLDVVSKIKDKEIYFDSLPTAETIDMFSIQHPRKYNIYRKYRRSSKFKFKNYASVEKDIGLQELCDAPIYFDEIKSITPLGEEETFDLEVPNTHNFVANDILVHNSVTLAVDALWWATAYPLVRMINGEAKVQKPFRVVIACPYENHVDELWTHFTALISDSPLLKEQVKRIRRSDYTIEFDNGSMITGYTVGISSANQGTSLRGISADMVIIDEMDYVPRQIMEAVIIPIWTTHTHCRLRVSSTPSGKRELFYEYCTRAEQLGWLHRHHPSWHPDNPNWMSIEQAKVKGLPITESTEYQVKAITSDANFIREYGGEFGEEFGGVYKHNLINRCLKKYARHMNLENTDIFDPRFEQNDSNYYILGVDWNSYTNGGQVVLVEYCAVPTVASFWDDETNQDVVVDFTNKFRLFYRRGIRAKDSTQRKTREEVIRLMSTKKIDYVYVDYGAGDTNIEELSHYGKDHPELLMGRKLKVVDSGSSVEHWDPILGKMVKKRAKSLMINASVLNLEEGRYVLPKEEDIGTRLVGQMRGYQIKNVTARGDYTYEGEDHILDAFNLAIFGFQKEFTNLYSSNVSNKIVFINDPRLKEYPTRGEESGSPVTTNKGPSIRDPERRQPAKGILPKMIKAPFVGQRSLGRNQGFNFRRTF